MSAMASQITSLTIVSSTVYSRRRWKKTSKLRVTGLCEGNSSVTCEFPAQRASFAENVSIWWRHHDIVLYVYGKQLVYNAIRITVNTYMLRIDKRYKNIMGEGGGGIFCVEYQREPLKFHRKYLTHTLDDWMIRFLYKVETLKALRLKDHIKCFENDPPTTPPTITHHPHHRPPSGFPERNHHI